MCSLYFSLILTTTLPNCYCYFYFTDEKKRVNHKDSTRVVSKDVKLLMVDSKVCLSSKPHLIALSHSFAYDSVIKKISHHSIAILGIIFQK